MSLRIVTCNVMPHAYAVVERWVGRHGHKIVLLVTSPLGTVERYGVSYLELVEIAAPKHPVLVTANLRTSAPVIAATEPDLLISASFPDRISARVTAIPRYGAYNLHPAPLPRGRGPNPLRLIYEGEDTAGATLHQISPHLDGGAIFSRREAPLPEQLSAAEIFDLWSVLCEEALDEGIARALAGEPGLPQDESQASYGAPFTLEERWLSWDRPAQLLRKQVAALDSDALATLDGEPIAILTLNTELMDFPDVPPGTVLKRTEREAVVRVQDGVVRVTFAHYDAGETSE